MIDIVEHKVKNFKDSIKAKIVQFVDHVHSRHTQVVKSYPWSISPSTSWSTLDRGPTHMHVMSTNSNACIDWILVGSQPSATEMLIECRSGVDGVLIEQRLNVDQGLIEGIDWCLTMDAFSSDDPRFQVMVTVIIFIIECFHSTFNFRNKVQMVR